MPHLRHISCSISLRSSSQTFSTLDSSLLSLLAGCVWLGCPCSARNQHLLAILSQSTSSCQSTLHHDYNKPSSSAMEAVAWRALENECNLSRCLCYKPRSSFSYWAGPNLYLRHLTMNNENVLHIELEQAGAAKWATAFFYIKRE